MKKRIYLVLEVKGRELDSRLSFSIYAAQNGYSVTVCKKGYLLSKLKYLKPGIVILKSIGIKNIKFIKEIKKYGHKCCSMDEEGLLFWTPEIYCRKRINEEIMSSIDFLFMWGINDYQAVLEKYPQYKKKLKITGSPRFDLLKPPLRKIYEEDSKILKEKYGKFLLINTNFGYTNHITADKNKLVENMVKNQLNDEAELRYHFNKLEIQKVRFNKIKIFIDRFSKNFPEYKVIVRPHQSEDTEIWKKDFKDSDNVLIIRDGFASIQWMLAAKIIISCNCTTGLEARFLNLNSLNFIPGVNNFSDYALPNDINFNIYDENVLYQKVSKIIEQGKNKLFVEYSEDKIIKSVSNINKNDVHESSKKLINYIFDLSDSIENKEDKYTNIISFNYFKFKRYMINLIFFKRFKNSRMYKLLIQKNPGTSLKEVLERTERMTNILKIKDLSIKELYPDVYCIEKK
jgi:surface carbohydrate biosynthesis protein